MGNVAGKIEIDSQIAAEMDARCVRISVLLTRMQSALARGDQERFRNLWEEVREKNWTNRNALLEAGARDSIRGDKPAPPDDDDLMDTDALKLSDLASAMTGEEDEQR